MDGQAQGGTGGRADEAVRGYLDGIGREEREVFDRLYRLITVTCPGVELGLSYGMPTYRVGRRRLNVGVWQHGVSLYVSPQRDGGFSARHPGLVAGKGTIRLRAADAAQIPDEEFCQLIRAALLG